MALNYTTQGITCEGLSERKLKNLIQGFFRKKIVRVILPTIRTCWDHSGNDVLTVPEEPETVIVSEDWEAIVFEFEDGSELSIHSPHEELHFGLRIKKQPSLL